MPLDFAGYDQGSATIAAEKPAVQERDDREPRPHGPRIVVGRTLVSTSSL
jgi:hypothetical protein